MKTRFWLTTLAFVLPTLAIIAIAGFKRHKTHPVQSNDPTVLVPQYAALVEKWEQAEYRPITNLTVADLRQLAGLDQVSVEYDGREELLGKLYRLIQAHYSGDWESLKEVMLPCGEDETRLSNPGRKIFSLLLTSGQSNTALDRYDGSGWDMMLVAWKQRIARAHLQTNWWAGIALGESRVWQHETASASALPEASSPLYGENAGVSWGKSMLEYPRLHRNVPGVVEGPVRLVAVRLLVKMQHRQKCEPHVFRWLWDPDCKTWFPYDECTGVVGEKAPGPFF